MKLTAGVYFIYNRSECFQQILIIHLLIRAYLSGPCCRPWLDALFVSCVWDELGWFCLRHVPVQYISWNSGHIGRFTMGGEFLWEVIINSEVILKGKVQAAVASNWLFSGLYFTLIIILLDFPLDAPCWTSSIGNMVRGIMCWRHFCYD